MKKLPSVPEWAETPLAIIVVVPVFLFCLLGALISLPFAVAGRVLEKLPVKPAKRLSQGMNAVADKLSSPLNNGLHKSVE